MSQQQRLKIPEPLREAYKLAIDQQWTVTRARNGHLRWSPPEGRPVQTAGSPRTCGHQVKNSLVRLRRAGLEC